MEQGRYRASGRAGMKRAECAHDVDWQFRAVCQNCSKKQHAAYQQEPGEQGHEYEPATAIWKTAEGTGEQWRETGKGESETCARRADTAVDAATSDVERCQHVLEQAVKSHQSMLPKTCAAPTRVQDSEMERTEAKRMQTLVGSTTETAGGAGALGGDQESDGVHTARGATKAEQEPQAQRCKECHRGLRQLGFAQRGGAAQGEAGKIREILSNRAVLQGQKEPVQKKCERFHQNGCAHRGTGGTGARLRSMRHLTECRESKTQRPVRSRRLWPRRRWETKR